MARRVRALAPAKVNLTLEVLGRRADGFHELASVMATCDLADDVRVAPAHALDVRLRPRGAIAGDDLAARAVRALAEAAGRPPHAHVLIRKRIPVAAGLGGGSSDAGTVLRALARLWRLADIDLLPLAAGVGSDVPFFAAGSPLARIAGRGERVEPLPAPAEPLWASLVTLARPLSTLAVFDALDGERHGSSSNDGASDEVARLFATGKATPAKLRASARNDLLAVAERLCPPIAQARSAARLAGIELSLSGSGPSLFAIADDRADAIRVSRALRRRGLRARPCRLADPGAQRLDVW